MDDSTRPVFEKAIAERLFIQERQAAGLSVDELARKMWPEQSVDSSRMKIHRFLKPQRTGNPKNMYLFDFIRYCEVLGIDPIRTLTEELVKMEKK